MLSSNCSKIRVIKKKTIPYEIGFYAPIITELCITIILRSGFFYFTALGGPCL